MKPSSSFISYHQGIQVPAIRGVADYLRRHDRMAGLMPTVSRMAALQKDCMALLPEAFNTCEVLQFSGEQLLLSVPNAAFAAKLKQRLPKLQEALQQRGWQVGAIRLKIQVRPAVENPRPEMKRPPLPPQAVSALAELGMALEDEPRNLALKTAIQRMVRRHQASR